MQMQERRAFMTENNLNRQSAQVARPSAGTYRPLTLADVHGANTEKKDGLPALLSQFQGGGSRTIWLSAPLLILLSSLTATQILTPLVLLCLLGVLLYRMDDTSRKLAAIPLTFGAFRLVTGVSLLLNSDGTSPSQRGWGGTGIAWETCLGLPWVPMLLAASLLYAPVRDAVTTKIMYWESIAMMISGLIPGQGFVGILCVIHYTLFIAIIVGLVIDLQKRSLWDSVRVQS
jgi:hypothetical protein